MKYCLQNGYILLSAVRCCARVDFLLSLETCFPLFLFIPPSFIMYEYLSWVKVCSGEDHWCLTLWWKCLEYNPVRRSGFFCCFQIFILIDSRLILSLLSQRTCRRDSLFCPLWCLPACRVTVWDPRVWVWRWQLFTSLLMDQKVLSFMVSHWSKRERNAAVLLTPNTKSRETTKTAVPLTATWNRPQKWVRPHKPPC